MSGPRVFQSVKVRLTLWYALILTVLLALFGYLMYTEFSRVLYGDVDKNLESAARQLTESLTSYLAPLPLKEKPAGEEAKKILADWEKANQRVRKSPVMIRVLLTDHSLLLDNLSRWQRDIIFPDFERDSFFMEHGTSYQVIHFQKRPVRMFYKRLQSPLLPDLILECATSLEEVGRAQQRLAFIIWIAVPAAVAASCVVGWFVIGRALHPVDSMIREARTITAANLQSRLPRTQAGDEIDRLAETLNEMMERIELSTRSIRDFSSDVSHELKTPLAIIKGEIEVALRRTRTTESLTETLKVIGGEVNEMIRLVDDLMLLVRSDAKQLKFEKKQLALASVLTNVADRFKERAAKKNIRFEAGLEQDADILGDEIYLKRLFSNLLDNAIKFTPEGGLVRVELIREKNRAVVRVADTGMGIELEMQAKVFSRFYRTDQARSHEGAGLGLNIAKTLSDAHNAAIVLFSQPGMGTTLTVSFPLYA